MGFGSFIKKAAKFGIRAGAAVSTGGASEVALAAKDAMSQKLNMPELPMGVNAADILAETEEQKRRRLEAAEELNPTGSLGAGAPQVKRPNILGA